MTTTPRADGPATAKAPLTIHANTADRLVQLRNVPIAGNGGLHRVEFRHLALQKEQADEVVLFVTTSPVNRVARGLVRGPAEVSIAKSLLMLAAVAFGGCYGGLGDDRPAAAAGTDAADEGADDGADGSEDDGADGDGSGDDGPMAACGDDGPSVAPRPMQRLTPVQYVNTMRDLVGDPTFTAEYDDLELVPTARGVRQLRTGAESAIATVDQWTAGLVPCDIHGAEDPTCADSVIDTFAPRAFRRPLTDQERSWLRAVYDEAFEEQGFDSGMQALLGTILQAPAFIYLTESGTPVQGAADTIRALGDYELASRLSYFVWDSMPDEALLEAAAAGELTATEGLRAQAERMLADPRAEAKMQAFVYHWLELDGGPAHFALGEQTKNGNYFPEYTPALVEAMKTELQAFVRRVLFEHDGNFDELLTSREAYVNASLAELYEHSGGPLDDDTWEWVELNNRRAGLLTRAAFLSTYASPDVQSPIRRGVWVYRELLCGSLGDPPPNASDVPVDGGEIDGQVLSVREDVELRTQGVDCRGCHQTINGIGFTFENYDAVGRWRSIELTSGRFVDATGALLGSDVDGDVNNAIDMSQRLTHSDMAKRCFATHWFEQAMGSEPEVADRCSVEHIQDSFSATGDVRQLLVDIAISETFRHINVAAEGE